MGKMTMIQAGLFAVLVGGAPFAFAGDPNPSDNTDEDCRQQWEKSSADNSCSEKVVERAGSGRCRVYANCYKYGDGGGWNYTWAQWVKYNETDDLYNCRGHLKIGGC